MNKIYLFDICGTLYKSNTTFDYLAYVLCPISPLYRCFEKARKNIVWRAFNRILRDCFHYDMTRIIALRFLKGYTREDLLAYSLNFYNDFLKNKENYNILSYLKKYKEQKENQVIIASATIDVVAEVIAIKLGVKERYSSQLKYSEGLCKGVLAHDLLGRKRQLLENLKMKEIEAVFTDDISDIPLLDIAKQKNIIVYSKTNMKWKSVVKEKRWNVSFIEC